MASEIAIVNSALSKLGADPIVSLEENSRVARLCKAALPMRKKALLRGHPWNFAIARQILARLTSTPEFEYAYQYQLPQNCSRVIYVGTYQDQEWTREGNLILTNADTCEIKFIRNDIEMGMVDDCFAEVLALDLAHNICYAITQSKTLKEELRDELKRVIAESRSFDGQEGSVKAPIASDWLNSRY